MTRIAHIADIHYCAKHLKWVDRAMTAAVDAAIENNCEACVIAGDSFDHGMSLHEPAVAAFVRQVVRLAARMHVVILQGTYSHDRPGCLDVFKAIPTDHDVLVADTPETWILELSLVGSTHDLLFCVLPSLNKADPAIMQQGVSSWTSGVMQGFAKEAAIWRERNIASILVTHGTVQGSVTESGYAMVSPDHEFDLETLLSAGTDAVMLGHIHKHQSWVDGGRTVAYPGSLARLVHGDHDPKGFLIWEIEPGRSESKFIELPTRQLLEIEFDGPPDFDDLRELAAKAGSDDAVRIRWHVDQEHAAQVDKAAIRDLFSHCDAVKLEGIVLAVQSVRAAGIAKALTLEEKLRYWCSTTGDEDRYDALAVRLQMLQSSDTETIIGRVAGK